MCVAIGVGVLVESLQVGGVPGGVLGEQQAARAGLLLEDVAEESTEGVELLLCPGTGGADISGVSPSIDNVEGLEVIKDEELMLLIMLELEVIWGDFIEK